MSETNDGGSPVHPALRAGLLKQAWQLHDDSAHDYPAFADAVRAVHAGPPGDPRLTYIAKRLWLEQAGEPSDKFLADLRMHSQRVVRETETALGDAPEWASQDLCWRTLSVWQCRWPLLLTAEHAVRILQNIGRVAATTGAAA